MNVLTYLLMISQGNMCRSNTSERRLRTIVHHGKVRHTIRFDLKKEKKELTTIPRPPSIEDSVEGDKKSPARTTHFGAGDNLYRGRKRIRETSQK
jgi:hypothetical protein